VNAWSGPAALSLPGPSFIPRDSLPIPRDDIRADNAWETAQKESRRRNLVTVQAV